MGWLNFWQPLTTPSGPWPGLGDHLGSMETHINHGETTLGALGCALLGALLCEVDLQKAIQFLVDFRCLLSIIGGSRDMPRQCEAQMPKPSPVPQYPSTLPAMPMLYAPFSPSAFCVGGSRKKGVKRNQVNVPKRHEPTWLVSLKYYVSKGCPKNQLRQGTCLVPLTLNCRNRDPNRSVKLLLFYHVIAQVHSAKASSCNPMDQGDGTICVKSCTLTSDFCVVVH